MGTKIVDYSTDSPPPLLDELHTSYQVKTPFEGDDDIKVISLEELLSFDRKSFSPTINWPGDIGPNETMSDGITNSTEGRVKRSDEKTPYDPVEENNTPPPLFSSRGGQLLICGNRNGINVLKDNRNVCNDMNGLRQLPKLTTLMDFSESDSNSSVFSIPDDRDIFGGNMYGEEISDDAGPEDWSS